jgi:uncharacterized protein (DUF58 family)
MTSRARTLGLIVAALLAGALALRAGALAWLALPFMAYLWAGLALAPVDGGTRLSASRRCVGEPGPEATRIEVAAELRNKGPRAIGVRLADPPVAGAALAEGSLEAAATLRPGEALELRYVLEAARGRFRWEELRARVGDPLGLFETEVRLPAPAEAKARPRFRRMRPFQLRLRQTLPSIGSVPVRQGGDGTDFWGIREFRRGDPLRRLYWRLFARYPNRPFAKDFVLERTAEIIIVLDGRLRMELVADGGSLFEREVEAAASLAAMLIRQAQRVGLRVIGARPREVQPDYGRVQLRRILDCLAEAAPEPEGGSAGYAMLFLRSLRYSRNAFFVFISPLDRDDELAFRRLRRLGYAGVLVSPDVFDFAKGFFSGEGRGFQADARRIAGLAARAGGIERRIRLETVARLSFPVIDWKVGSDLGPLLDGALSRAAGARGRG